MIQKFIAKLSPKEKKILAVAVIIFLMAFLDRVFFGPAIDNLKSLEEDIQDKETSLKRYLRFLAYKDQISKEKDMLKKYYTKKQLTPGEIKEAFLNKIEMLANESKISSIRVTPTEGEKKKGYVEYAANLECLGKLKDILTFMHAIDSSEELMKIIKFSMNAKKASSDEVSVSMSVSKIIVDSEMTERKEYSSNEKKETVEKKEGKNPPAPPQNSVNEASPDENPADLTPKASEANAPQAVQLEGEQ